MSRVNVHRLHNAPFYIPSLAPLHMGGGLAWINNSKSGHVTLERVGFGLDTSRERGGGGERRHNIYFISHLNFNYQSSKICRAGMNFPVLHTIFWKVLKYVNAE